MMPQRRRVTVLCTCHSTEYCIFRVSPALCNVPVSVPKCAVHVSLSKLTGQQEKSGAEIGAQKSGWRLIGEEDKEILSCRRP